MLCYFDSAENVFAKTPIYFDRAYQQGRWNGDGEISIGNYRAQVFRFNKQRISGGGRTIYMPSEILVMAPVFAFTESEKPALAETHLVSLRRDGVHSIYMNSVHFL